MHAKGFPTEFDEFHVLFMSFTRFSRMCALFHEVHVVFHEFHVFSMNFTFFLHELRVFFMNFTFFFSMNFMFLP